MLAMSKQILSKLNNAIWPWNEGWACNFMERAKIVLPH